MRALVVALNLPLAASGAPGATDLTATAVAGPHTIRVSGAFVSRIGAFHPRRNPTIAAAERAFGSASSRRLLGDNVCRVEWRRLKLRIDFANFGGTRPGETTCSPTVGKSQSFSVRGRRFRTWKGLRVGQRSDEIQIRHPAAEFRQRTWWLRTAASPFGAGSEYGVVRAIVSNHRVRALKGWIGAAGE